MTHPSVAEGTSEYLRKADFDAAMERIKAELSTVIGQEINKALDQNNARLEEKIAQTKGEIRGELNAKLDSHITQEREQRQADIEAVREQIQTIGNVTSSKFTELNGMMDNIKQSVEGLSSEIRTWRNSLDANQRLYDANRRDIEIQESALSKVKEDLDTLEETQVATSGKLKSIHYAIYGGNGDGPKSLYALVEEMKQQMELGFSGQQTQLTAALELARSTATRQDQYEKDLAERKQRWSKQRGLALEAGKKLLTTPKGLASLGFMIVSLVAIFRPEALPTLIQFFNQLFGANP